MWLIGPHVLYLAILGLVRSMWVEKNIILYASEHFASMMPSSCQGGTEGGRKHHHPLDFLSLPVVRF